MTPVFNSNWRMHHFIGNLGEEAPFHLFIVSKTGLVQNRQDQNYGCCLEFCSMVHALPGGLVIYIKLFYWFGLIIEISGECKDEA